MSLIVNAPKRAQSTRKTSATSQVALIRELGVNKAINVKSAAGARTMATLANGFLPDRQFSAYLATDGKYYIARTA